jgi:hypothetical protein
MPAHSNNATVVAAPAATSTATTATTPQTREELLGAAFDEAVAPGADGSLPDNKTAYMLFLRNAEQRGCRLPQGAFE